MVRSLIAAGAPLDYPPGGPRTADRRRHRARPPRDRPPAGRRPGRTFTGGHEWPALHHAANVGHADLVALLLRPEPTSRGARSPTAGRRLHLARVAGGRRGAAARGGGRGRAGRPRRCDAAHRAGRLPRGPARPSGPPAPRAAAAWTRSGTARVLLDAGRTAQIETTNGAKGFTALQTAPSLLRGARLPLAVLCLERGADANARGLRRASARCGARSQHLREVRGRPGAEPGRSRCSARW